MIKHQMLFLVLKISKIWLKKMQRRGKTSEELQRRRIKSTIVFVMPSLINTCENRAKKLLQHHLVMANMRYSLKTQITECHKQFSVIQKRIRDK